MPQQLLRRWRGRQMPRLTIVGCIHEQHGSVGVQLLVVQHRVGELGRPLVGWNCLQSSAAPPQSHLLLQPVVILVGFELESFGACCSSIFDVDVDTVLSNVIAMVGLILLQVH